MRFLHHINHMRGIAIIPIVAVHCISIFDWPEHSVANHLYPLFTNVNIMFIFVSGYLFIYLSDSYTYKTYLKSKLNNVIVPYLFISAPAIFIYLAGLKPHPHLAEGFFDSSPAYQAAFFLLTGAHLGPLWFIPMMGVFYLASFIFKYLVSGRWFVAVLPGLFLFSEWLGRPEYNVGTLQLAAYFAPVYLLGMAFARHSATLNVLLRRNVAPIVVAGLAAGAAAVAPPAHGIFAPQLVLKTVICVAVYATLLTLPERRIPSLDLLARYSFGIFFVHGYLVGFGRIIAGTQPHAVNGTIPSLLLSIIVVLAASIAATGATKAFLGQHSRLVLGS